MRPAVSALATARSGGADGWLARHAHTHTHTHTHTHVHSMHTRRWRAQHAHKLVRMHTRWWADTHAGEDAHKLVSWSGYTHVEHACAKFNEGTTLDGNLSVCSCRL